MTSLIKKYCSLELIKLARVARALIMLLSMKSLLPVAIAILTLQKALSQDESVKDDVARANAIIEWVRSKGGFFSEKLEIHRFDKKDSTSPLGVFAKQDIKKDERLLEVPHSCFLGLWDKAKDVDYDAVEPNMQDYYHNVCALSHKLAAELKLGDESEYAPYMDYVKHQQHGQLPATFSKQGKALMRKVAYNDWNMVDWMAEYDCDPLDSHMLAMVTQRGYDTALIPIWDMFNHRNGRFLNTRNDPMYDGDRLRVWANTDIGKGQEVYATYNECVDCGAMVKWFWGTPEVLRDFGFVEQFPQRWVFLRDDDDEGIWFEIDEGKHGELEVVWDISDEDDDYDEDDYGIPDDEAIEFLESELKRLQRLKETHLTDQRQVPHHEWSTILQFHEALVTAISLAIESAEAFHSQEEQEL